MGVRTKALVAALVIAQLSIVTIGNSPTTLAAGEGTISGSVLTDGTSTLKAPFDGGGAQPVPATVNVVDSASGDTVATTTTDAAGAYTVAGLDLGSYQVSATVEGNATPWWHGGTFGERTAATPATIILDSTVPTRTNVNLTLPTGGFGGWIYGPDGAGFGFFGATATFTETTSGYTESVTVGPDGGFGLGYIPVGSYDLTVTWPGGTYTFPDPYLTGPIGYSMAVSVPGVVSGTVLTDGTSTLKAPYDSVGQQPVPYATVTVVDATTGSILMSRQADESGFYSFGYGVPGTYQLYAQAPGNTGKLWFDGAGFGERVDVAPTVVTIADTSTRVADVNFAFPTGGFGGWVLPTINGVDTTIRNASVTFTKVVPQGEPAYMETATIDAQGGFGLGYIPTGEYTATISYETDAAPGYQRTFNVPGTYETGDIGLSVAFDLPITPPAPATLRGTVFRADASPAGGALVRLLRADGTVQTSVNTQPDGSYLMTVAPGSYRIAVAQGSESAVIPVVLAEGSDMTRDVTLVPAAANREVSGSFVDGDGVAYTSGNVYFTCDGGVNANVSITNGTFSTTLPDAPCTYYGNLFRSTRRDPLADPMLYTTNIYNENYQIPTTQLPATGPYDFTVDTVELTINVATNGTETPIRAVTVSGYDYTSGPGFGTPQATFKPNGFNNRIGDTMPAMPGTTATVTGPFTIDALALANVTITIALTDGRTLTQTINTTNGLARTITIDVPTLALRPVSGSFVDGDGVAYTSGNVYFTCDGGVNANVSITNGTFSTTLPDAPCTYYGNLFRSTRRDPLADPMLYTTNIYNENYQIPTTQLPATGPYDFTVDTVELTINVATNGTETPIRAVTVSGYDYTSGPGFGTPQATFKPNGFNNRIGDTMPAMPGTTATVTGPFTIDALALANVTITIALTDGRTLTQTINTTNGPTNVELNVSGATPFFVVSATGAQSDTDGVDDYTESFAPNNGDGDNDGVKDAEQPNVASFPSATPDQTYVTLKTSSPGAVIQNVRTIEAVANPDNAPVGWTAPPANFVLPEGLADFQVSGLTPGATEQITIFSSNTSKITGYAKFQNGTWKTLPTENVEILADRVIITLVDGGVGDDDGLANGVIVDPGGIVEVTDSEPPVITCPAAATVGFRSIGATLTASVTDDGVGVSSPSVTVDLDTGTPGAQTVAVRAADTVGNEATVDCGFRVAYNVQEFTPVQFGSIARSVRNSTTVPFTFRVTDALGAAVTGDVVSAPVTATVACPGGFVLPMLSAAFLPEATFQIGNGSWFAGWRPPRSMRNTCQQVTIALDDGSSLQYVIKVT